MSLETLRRLAAPARSAEARPPADRCGLCAAVLGAGHGHVVDLDQRSLICACRACHLLFTGDGAGGGRRRAVPRRWLHDPARPLTDAEWAGLDVPVTTAFFFAHSGLGRVVACYPSPAGATESLLDLDSWERLRVAHPLLAAPAADVEAIYVTPLASRLEAFLVPIDACYHLVGEVRLRWRGLDGGDGVRHALSAFAEDLRTRSRPLPASGGAR
jgi:hypothetical protein